MQKALNAHSLQLTRDTRLEASLLLMPRPQLHPITHTPIQTPTHSVRGMSLAFIQFMICIRSLSVAFGNYNTQSIWKYAALDDHNVAYYADDTLPHPSIGPSISGLLP